MIEGWPETDASQILLLEQIHSFVAQHLTPIAPDLDKNGQFPTSIIQKLGQMGVLGMMVPETWGGSGIDTVSYAMTIEEIASSCASTAVIVSVNNSLVCSPLLKYGNEYQKSQFLTPLARGEKLGCFALSEPGHGSDPAGIQCQAYPSAHG